MDLGRWLTFVSYIFVRHQSFKYSSPVYEITSRQSPRGLLVTIVPYNSLHYTNVFGRTATTYYYYYAVGVGAALT